MKRFWIRWRQSSDDFRPLQDPPQPDNIKAWWCSGEGDGYSTLCAIVDAETEKKAQAAVKSAWDSTGNEVEDCNVTEKPHDWLPGNRFPVTADWERQRLGIPGAKS